MEYKTEASDALADSLSTILAWNPKAKVEEVAILLSAWISTGGKESELVHLDGVLEHGFCLRAVQKTCRLNLAGQGGGKRPSVSLLRIGRTIGKRSSDVFLTSSGIDLCRAILDPLLRLHVTGAGYVEAANTLNAVISNVSGHHQTLPRIADIAFLLALYRRGAEAQPTRIPSPNEFNTTPAGLRYIIRRLSNSFVAVKDQRLSSNLITITDLTSSIIGAMLGVIRATNLNDSALSVVSKEMGISAVNNHSEWKEMTVDFLRPYLLHALNSITIPDFHEARKSRQLPIIIDQKQSVCDQKIQYELLRSSALGLIGRA